jgi:hypothetical protein
MTNRISIPHAQWKFLRERMLAVDYTTKFALYCAELVIEDAPHA